MNKLSIQAVIFDADGVIFDSEKLWDIGDGEFMATRGIKEIDGEVKIKLAGTSLYEGTKLLLESYGLNEDIQKASVERVKRMEELYKTSITFMDGFPEFFEWIKKKKLSTAVATSMNKSLFPFVNEHTGFLEMFDRQVYSVSDVTFPKPAPDIYLYAAEKLGVQAANCLVIEDAPNGIKAAKSAGMFCVGIATTFQDIYLKEADHICKTFDEIKALIRTLN